MVSDSQHILCPVRESTTESPLAVPPFHEASHSGYVASPVNSMGTSQWLHFPHLSSLTRSNALRNIVVVAETSWELMEVMLEEERWARKTNPGPEQALLQ